LKNKQIILIRHAEAAASWGTSNPDPGLSNIGKKQAKILSKRKTKLNKNLKKIYLVLDPAFSVGYLLKII